MAREGLIGPEAAADSEECPLFFPRPDAANEWRGATEKEGAHVDTGIVGEAMSGEVGGRSGTQIHPLSIAVCATSFGNA